jgi:hypothetical protein
VTQFKNASAKVAGTNGIQEALKSHASARNANLHVGRSDARAKLNRCPHKPIVGHTFVARDKAHARQFVQTIGER